MWPLLGTMLLACVAPVGLSDDEDVLSTPRDTGLALDSGVAEETGVLGVEGWVAQSAPLEGTPDVSSGTLEAARDDGEGVACRHTGIVAPCGELRPDAAADLGTASDVRVHYLLGSAGAAICSWEVSFRIVGIAPEISGTVSMSMAVDGEDVGEMSTSATYAGDGGAVR